jgi:ribosomal protein S18 acetylase RimI-like enzyme
MNPITELSDAKIITDILNKSFLTVASQFNFTKDNAPRFPAFINSTVIEKQLMAGLKIYGYSINDQIVACIGYSYCKERVYSIERLAVLPEYRHLGIGKKLMEYTESKIKAEDGSVAEIHVVDLNDTLVEWYKKLAYKQIRIDVLTNMPFNSCVMIKNLIKT